MLGYALIGCGYISRRHADAIMDLEGAQLMAVCDTQRDRAQALAAALGDDTIAAETDYESLLKRDDIQVAVVCLPTCLHEPVSVRFAEAGKHVFVEKPIAGSLRSARRMIDVCAAAGTRLCVGQSHRYMPVVRRARELVQSGKLGRVFKARVSGCFFEDVSKETRRWKLDPETEIGGLLDNGIHYADDLRYILGKEARAVFARTRTIRKDIMKQKEEGLALLTFEDDINAVWEVCACQWSAHSPLPKAWDLEVHGTGGSLALTLGGELRAFSCEDGHETEIKEQHHKDFKEIAMGIHRDFLAAIVEGGESFVRGEDGYESLRIVLAILESSESGEVVDLR